MVDPEEMHKGLSSEQLRLDSLISAILRVGMLTSVTLIVLGSVLCFTRDSRYGSELGLAALMQHGAFPHTATAVWRDAIHGGGMGLVMLGVLVMVATPILRVIVSIIAFAWESDVVYTLLTAAVLGLLLVALIAGKAG